MEYFRNIPSILRCYVNNTITLKTETKTEYEDDTEDSIGRPGKEITTEKSEENAPRRNHVYYLFNFRLLFNYLNGFVP